MTESAGVPVFRVGEAEPLLAWVEEYGERWFALCCCCCWWVCGGRFRGACDRSGAVPSASDGGKAANAEDMVKERWFDGGRTRVAECIYSKPGAVAPQGGWCAKRWDCWLKDVEGNQRGKVLNSGSAPAKAWVAVDRNTLV